MADQDAPHTAHEQPSGGVGVEFTIGFPACYDTMSPSDQVLLGRISQNLVVERVRQLSGRGIGTPAYVNALVSWVEQQLADFSAMYTTLRDTEDVPAADLIDVVLDRLNEAEETSPGVTTTLYGNAEPPATAQPQAGTRAVLHASERTQGPTAALSNGDGNLVPSASARSQLLRPSTAQELLATAPETAPRNVLTMLTNVVEGRSPEAGLSQAHVDQAMSSLLEMMVRDNDRGIAILAALRNRAAAMGAPEEILRGAPRNAREREFEARVATLRGVIAREAAAVGVVAVDPTAGEEIDLDEIDLPALTFDSDSDSGGVSLPGSDTAVSERRRSRGLGARPRRARRRRSSSTVSLESTGSDREDEELAGSRSGTWTELSYAALQTLEREGVALPAEGDRSVYLGDRFQAAFEVALGRGPLAW